MKKSVLKQLHSPFSRSKKATEVLGAIAIHDMNELMLRRQMLQAYKESK